MGKKIFIFIYCLITKLPGPPRLKIDGLNFQLIPIDRKICPGIVPYRDVIFELYSSNFHGPEILGFDIQPKNFDFSLPTVLFLHGFLETSSSDDAVAIREAYLSKQTHNIIIVNAGRLLSPSYNLAVKNSVPIAQYIAHFIDYLVNLGLNLKEFHMIGMSLGAQIVGIAGSLVKSGKVGRITGLDPAGPIYSTLPESFRLDESDAEFVDVIHTDAGIFGFPKQQGHIDIWINLGVAPQPGCQQHEISQRNPFGVSEKVFCNHWRSYQIYAASIENPTKFVAVKCFSWAHFLLNKCLKDHKLYVGYYTTPESANGNYFLRTNYPFS